MKVQKRACVREGGEKMNKIVTVGREFGSGGRELGRRLAEELGIAYYDKEIVTEIARRTELSEQYVQSVVERKPVVLYPIHVGRSFYPALDAAAERSSAVYAQQHEIIREMADKSDCVIVGRCADYILRESKPLRLFVYADMESKIARCRKKAPEQEHLSDKKLARMIKKIDAERAHYYFFYTGKKWGDPLNFDVCVNTTHTDIKALSKAIAKLCE